MNFQALLSAYFLLAVSIAESPDTSPGVALTKTTKHEHLSSITTTTTTTSAQKPTEHKSAGNFTLTDLDLDGSMIQRALYVLIGITIIGVLYFLVRAVRLKKSNAQRKKYGLLSNYDDTVEMAQLESDEEDTTVYEAKSLRR